MTYSPTSQPTSFSTSNSTTPATSEDIGTTIGTGVIIGIVVACVGGVAAIFNKLICFKIFDYFGADRGLLQDICSCYKKTWQEARTPISTDENNNKQNSENHDQEEGKHNEDTDTHRQDRSNSYHQYDDLQSNFLGNKARGAATPIVIPPMNTAEIELQQLVAEIIPVGTPVNSVTSIDGVSTNSSLLGLNLVNFNEV